MKRVLSIMLTMMLVFSLFTGVITVQAVEYEVMETLVNTDYSTTLSSYAVSSGSEFRINSTKKIQFLSPFLTTAEKLEPSAIDATIASGLTSKQVFKAPVGGKDPAIRWRNLFSVAADEQVRIKFRVYLDGTSNPDVTSYSAYLQMQNTTTSSTGDKFVEGNSLTVPVGKWCDVSVIETLNVAHGGLKVTFQDPNDGGAYPTTVYLDGNFTVETVQEKAAEPAIAIDSHFKNNMLFQRNAPIDVWGTSTETGKTVTATLGDNTATTTTDATGKWKVTLPAMSAQTGLTLNVSCDDEAETSIDVTNVAIGEVILAAGQSNMNKSVASLHDTTVEALAEESAEVKSAVADLQNVDVRMLNFKDTNANSYTWARVTKYEDSSDADCIYHRSLIGFMTAYKLAKEKNIPVAFVDAAIGGAAMRAFLSPETLASREEYANLTVADSSETDMDTLKHAAAGLYNVWLSNLKGFKVGSAIWYQGEQDATENVSKELYDMMLTDLVNQLRSDFGNNSMPVAVCQLTPHSNANYVTVRQSQMDVSNKMNGVYLIPTADAGPTAAETDALHPLNKMPVINRSLNVIKFHNFGDVVEYSGPTYKKMTVDGNEATLAFDNVFNFEIAKSYKSMVNDRAVSGSGSTLRFGLGSSAARMEFRDDDNTGNFTSLTKDTAANLSVTYPDIALGSTGSSLAKMTRTGNVGYVRFAELVQGNVFKAGDRVRVTVRAYPTDMVGNADTITWSIKGLRHADDNTTGTKGHGTESNIYLKTDQWNTIVYETTCHDDMVSGAQIQFNPVGETSYPATIFFDDYMVIERVAAADIEANSLKTSDGGDVKGFKVCGADGVFYDATAEIINGNQITVSSESVANPVEVQYCNVSWDENDHSTLGGNVVNAAGIPMVPFKATLQDADIVSASLIDGYSYKVNLASVGYNAVTGKIVTVLYDGDILADVQFVDFNAAMYGETTKTVTFTPAGEVTNPSVKIMAWNSMNTLVPYCAAFPVQ